MMSIWAEIIEISLQKEAMKEFKSRSDASCMRCVYFLNINNLFQRETVIR